MLQYFWVLKFADGFGRDVANAYFDMEDVYIDRDEGKPDDLGDPVKNLAWRLIPTPDYTPKWLQGGHMEDYLKVLDYMRIC